MLRGDMKKLEIKRGDVFFVDLSPTVGSEQGGKRPVLVLQNDLGNKFSPTIIVASITSQITKAKLPTHVEVSREHGFTKDSVILLEQIRTIDKSRIVGERITHLSNDVMRKVSLATSISLGLIDMPIPVKRNNREMVAAV